jgi:predicted DCC family thiol-disulfide oxidoreductase YuxK
MKSNPEDSIIFFDGVCGLCNGFVDFVLRIDHSALFKFSPLQSDFAAQRLPKEYINDLDSVVVIIDGNVLRKGAAVFAVFQKLGGAWAILSIFGKLPTGIVNSGYDLVASNRYKIFGKKETCRLPTPSERERFIL